MPKDDNKNAEMVKEIKAKLDFVYSYRFAAEKVWWEVQSFLDGYHYNIFKDNKTTNTIELRAAKFKSGDVRRVINLIRKVYRDTKALVSVASYRWTVIGGNGPEDKYLQDYFDTYNVGQVVGQVAGLGFRRSVGYAEVYWDGKKVCCEPLDPFLIYEDPGHRFFIKSYVRRMKELQDVKMDGQPVYINLDKNKMEQTDKQTHSDLYNFLYTRDHSNEKCESEELKKFLITEIIVPDEDSATASITTISGEQIIRENKLSAYKILAYRPEIEDDIYTNPMLESLLHPAKALNRTINHTEEYIRYMAQGRYLIRKGEKVNEIKTEHGQQLEYDKRPPEHLAIQPLPDTVRQYLDLMIGFHTQLSGVRLNQLPSNLSGKALAYYQAMEQQNATEPMENLKVFMRQLAMTIIEIADTKQAIAKNIYFKDGEEMKDMRIVGSIAGEGNKTDKSIKKPERIDVEIIPGGAFALLNQKEEAKEMYKMGLIGRKGALELSKIGNLREIIADAEAEEARAAALKTSQETPEVAGSSPAAAIAMKELPESVPQRTPMR